MRGDPKWIESHFIIDRRVDHGNVEFSATGNRGDRLSEEGIKVSLIYQLHERLQFVKPPDPIVGMLLLDLGELVGAESSGQGGAAEVFNLALTYVKGFPSLEHDAEVKAMTAQLELKAERKRLRASYVLGLISTGIFVFVLLPLLVIDLKRRLERNLSVEHAPIGSSAIKRIAAERSSP